MVVVTLLRQFFCYFYIIRIVYIYKLFFYVLFPPDCRVVPRLRSSNIIQTTSHLLSGILRSLVSLLLRVQITNSHNGTSLWKLIDKPWPQSLILTNRKFRLSYCSFTRVKLTSKNYTGTNNIVELSLARHIADSTYLGQLVFSGILDFFYENIHCFQ